MTCWSSSLLLPETRTASPWICDLTLGNSSRMSLVIRLASSSGRPRRSLISWRTLLPPAGSTLPQSKILSDRLRRIAFDSMRSLTAAARYSSSVTRTSSSLACVEVDRHALEVVALPDLAPDLVERVAQLLFVEVADDVERDVSCHAILLALARGGGSRRCRHSRNRAIRPSAAISRVMKPARRTRARSTGDVAGVPGGEHRRAGDPVPLDRELDVLLRLGRVEQVCPERIVADERRLERILVVLGVLGEQADQASPSNGSQAWPYARAGRRRSRDPGHRQAAPPGARSSRRDPVAAAAAHHEDGVARPDLRRPARRPSPRPSPAPPTGDPAGRVGDGGGEAGRRGDRRVRVAAGPDVGDGDRVRLGERIGEVARAARPSDGTSAARRPPRRAGPARAGGPRRSSRGWPSDGGRSRRRPRPRRLALALEPPPDARERCRAPRTIARGVDARAAAAAAATAERIGGVVAAGRRSRRVDGRSRRRPGRGSRASSRRAPGRRSARQRRPPAACARSGRPRSDRASRERRPRRPRTSGPVSEPPSDVRAPGSPTLATSVAAVRRRRRSQAANAASTAAAIGEHVRVVPLDAGQDRDVGSVRVEVAGVLVGLDDERPLPAPTGPWPARRRSPSPAAAPRRTPTGPAPAATSTWTSQPAVVLLPCVPATATSVRPPQRRRRPAATAPTGMPARARRAAPDGPGRSRSAPS